MENGVKADPYPLDRLQKWFSEARDLCQDARTESQTDDDYYHGYQLTSTEREVLRNRKQPDGIFNRVRKAINGTLGVLKQGQVDPRAFPRNPQDEESADVASKVLRYLKDVNDWDAARIECARDYLVPGTTAAIVEVDEDRKPTVEQIRWEQFFHDPRARKADFSDARYMGIAKWMYADDLAAMYPDHASSIDDGVGQSGPLALDETFEDRPRDARSQWYDRKHRRCMVVEMYHRERDGWQRCVFFAGSKLDGGPSPYLDAKGKPANPIVAQSCYIDRENTRYGIARDMRAPQDEFNKRRQKLLHMLNNRQVQTQPNADLAMMAIADADTVRAEAARPDGVLPPGWAPTSLNDLASGQFNLLTMAEGEMDREGPNPAVLGRLGSNESGRAQMVRQQAGLTEQAVIFGGFEAWELRIYRALWDRARQFMQGPEWVRITDDKSSPEFVGINQPVMGQAQPVLLPDGSIGIQPRVLGYKNAIAEMDVDIVLDTVPDTANLAAEQFQGLIDLASSGAVQIPPDILIEASSLPNKRELIEKMQKGQETNPMQQQAMQMEMEGRAAEIDKTKSETVRNLADAQAKGAQVEMKAFDTGLQAAQPQQISR